VQRTRSLTPFIPCSKKIVRAVTDMVLLFPEELGHSAVSARVSHTDLEEPEGAPQSKLGDAAGHPRLRHS